MSSASTMPAAAEVQDADANALDLGWQVLERARHHPDLASLETPHPYTGQPFRGWHPLGLDPGDLGMALAYSAADELRPDDGWDEAAFEHVQRAVSAFTHQPGLGIGLFGGTAGLAYALRALSRDGSRYQRAVHDVDAVLHTRIDAALRAVPYRGGMATAEYDVISGLAGAGMYVVQTDALSGPLADSARRIVDLFVDLLLVPAPGGIWTPPERITELERQRHTHLHGGYLNLGYAHGLAGVLSFLGTAYRRGLDGLRRQLAVQTAAERLLAAVRTTEHGPDVPYHDVPADGCPSSATLTRCAWCYGNPGAALALANSGLSDPETVVACRALLEAAHARPVSLRFVDNPSLCHGMAGQLLIERHMARVLPEAGPPYGPGGSPGTRPGDLLRFVHPGAGFCLQNEQLAGCTTDSPGFLEGSGGAAVALITSGAERRRPTKAEALLTGAVVSREES